MREFFDKSMWGLPVLLFAASCVPTASAGTGDVHLASLTAQTPTQAPQPVPTATEVPPPPEILAQEIAVGDPARPFDLGPASRDDAESALECLTAAVYYEARSQSDDGQRAVAQVVLNRVRHPAFPKTVCGVVYQGSNRSTGCQFTFTCDGSLRRPREPFAWLKARKIAAAALAGYVFTPVGLATHYHTTAIHPWWADAMSKAVTIGAHVFYRWNGAWGDPKSFQRPYVGAEGDGAGLECVERQCRRSERADRLRSVDPSWHRRQPRQSSRAMTDRPSASIAPAAYPRGVMVASAAPASAPAMPVRPTACVSIAPAVTTLRHPPIAGTPTH